MRIELLSVGTELLLGDVLNTNVQYLSRRLAELGMVVHNHTTVGDNPGRILAAFAQAFARADMVITTGGLGPTQDDLSKELAAEYFGHELELHEPSWQVIQGYFERIKRPMSPNNKKQAMMPKGCLVLDNPVGTAPGCLLQRDDKFIACLPGPPREMSTMFEQALLPWLQLRSDGVIRSRSLRFASMGESSMAQALDDLINGSTNPSLAPYASGEECYVRASAKAASAEEAEALLEQLCKQVYERLGHDIYGENDASLDFEVGRLLCDQGLSLSVAESCTGGLLSAALVNYPGISKCFSESVVVYSNEAKERLLGIDPTLLQKHGAVSAQTAEAMASTVARNARSDLGISITGIAGPSGGSEEKPVGLVFIGFAVPAKGVVRHFKLQLGGNRERVRRRSTREALILLWRYLSGREL